MSSRCLLVHLPGYRVLTRCLHSAESPSPSTNLLLYVSLAASHASGLEYMPIWLESPLGAVTDSIHTMFAVNHIQLFTAFYRSGLFFMRLFVGFVLR